MRVDAHVHAFETAGRHDLRNSTQVFPDGRREPVEQLLADFSAAQIDAAVLVALPGQEAYVLRALAEHREQLAGVLTMEGRRQWPSADDLERWASSGVAGLRFTSLADAERLAGSAAALARGLGDLGGRGLTVSCFLPAHEWSFLARLASQLPSTRFVLNHCGLPRGDSRVDEWRRPRSLAAWQNGSSADVFADMENVWVCLSGSYAYSSQEPPYRDVQEWAAHLVVRFGPQRLMRGSDYPWVRTRPGYAAELETFDDLLDDLTDDAAAAVRGTNAQTAFFSGRRDCITT